MLMHVVHVLLVPHVWIMNLHDNVQYMHATCTREEFGSHTFSACSEVHRSTASRSICAALPSAARTTCGTRAQGTWLGNVWCHVSYITELGRWLAADFLREASGPLS
jgi:hypothetical protein